MRGKAPKVMIESFAPEPPAAHGEASSQKRGLVHNIQDCLSPAGCGEVALSLDFPLPIITKLPQDAEQASSFVSDNPQEDARKFWNRTAERLCKRATKLEGRSAASSWGRILIVDRLSLKSIPLS